MQNLYMMAALIREQQMRKMTIEINQEIMTIEQAMVEYNVATKEAVLNRLENLNSENKRPAANHRHDSISLKAQAA